MQILVSPKAIPGDNDALDREFQVFKSSLAASNTATASSALREVNLGLGADWIVFTIDLSLWLGAAVLIVPQTHKYIRESYEECKKIHAEVLTLIDKVRGDREVVRYPVELLYLMSLSTVLAHSESREVRFLSHRSLPVPSELTNGFAALQHHLFLFAVGSDLKLIAIDSNRQVLWEQTVAEKPPASQSTVGW
jgi:hypothetical protein